MIKISIKKEDEDPEMGYLQGWWKIMKLKYQGRGMFPVESQICIKQVCQIFITQSITYGPERTMILTDRNSRDLANRRGH